MDSRCIICGRAREDFAMVFRGDPACSVTCDKERLRRTSKQTSDHLSGQIAKSEPSCA